MAMCLSVTYTPCAKSLREQTGDIITFAQFEEGDILSETRNNEESGEESNDDSIMQPLLSKEEIDAMDSENESDNEPIYTQTLEDIRDISHSHPNINKREAHYKICYHINKDKQNGNER